MPTHKDLPLTEEEQKARNPEYTPVWGRPMNSSTHRLNKWGSRSFVSFLIGWFGVVVDSNFIATIGFTLFFIFLYLHFTRDSR